MKWIYNDGGRKAAGFNGQDKARDCVARAVAIASGRPYLEVYNRLADGNATQRVTKSLRKDRARVRSASNGINVGRKWFKEYMRELGFEWVPTMRIGSGCRVHLHDQELPGGRLVVSVSKHYTAVIEREIHDTH